LDSLCELTLSRGIGLAKKPALDTVPCPAGGQTVPRHAQQGGGRTADRLHDRTVNPVFPSYEHTSEAIRAKCRHTLATPPPLFTARKRKLGKYTTMIGNIGSDNFIGRKLKTG